VRYLSPWLHREMMSELRWPGRDTLEWGIDVRTLELDSSDLAKLAIARRGDIMEQLAAWDAGRALGEITRDRVRASSGLAIVTAAGAEPVDYVRAGMAVERLWLAADRAGLRVQPVSPVFIYAVDDADWATLVPESVVAHLRELAGRFRATAGVAPDRTLGLVLRLHHSAAPTTRSARLPVAQVLRRPTRA
jgi:hypothetical protein